ncbi:MAG: hypothetical protein HC831_11950 [Chloroflexia bacterium]|nr:hypothetical protein [Chloroflexia bacterium]
MIAATIGRTFLKAFNEKYNCNYTPKQFFDEVYFETFYNHNKYMQWVTNSPFVQMKKGQKPETLSKNERVEKLSDFHKKVSEGCKDASIAIGFAANESSEYATTSGLVTDLIIDVSSDDIYYSWIGGGLGIGVAGGYSIYYNDGPLLLDTFEGWKVYRKYLNDTVLERMRGNQINTWNGQWLTFYLGKDYNEQFDFSFLTQKEIFHSDAQLVEVNTVSWNELFFSISRKYPDQSRTGYVYSLGQTNKTLGFYPILF